jgi:hypothetical protein
VKLYHALRAGDEAGLSPGITSAYRDDYRQSIASGLKAASNRSYHGGSLRGGYGHGLAADVVSTKGSTRDERWTSSDKLWQWIDAHGEEFGIARPYHDRDPPHVAPIDGKEYATHHHETKTQHAGSDMKQRNWLAALPENPPSPAQPAPSIAQVAAAEAALPRGTALAQTAPQEAAPTAAALPDHTQLLQTMARDLANVEREVEQLKANQQKTASDNSTAIEQLRASQEEMGRLLARISEQNLPKTSPPSTLPQPTPTSRKPERTLRSPHARARPRIPPPWIYQEEEW